MIIISHRGYWNSPDEKNSRKAFENSFSLNFGTETDIRDYNGDLVISHDIPNGRVLRVKDFFEIHSQFDVSLPLALNIKADGLQSSLKKLLQEHNISNYFVFDMSIPDMLIYLKEGFNVFTRQSEFEKEPSFYDEAVGVWIDCFENDWIQLEDIKFHLNNGKKVCLVSPELHKRDHVLFWERFTSLDRQAGRNVLLCTDRPEDARRYFS
jgi:hypothetical protein